MTARDRIEAVRNALAAVAELPDEDLARLGCVAAIGELEHYARRLALASGLVTHGAPDVEVQP